MKLDVQTLRDLLDEKLPRSQVRAIQSGFKDADRFDKYVAREDAADGPAGKKVAYIDEIQYIPVPEESVRADGVGTGEYHIGDSLAPDSYARTKSLQGVEADIGKPYYWAVAHMNKKECLFTNVKLRQAVS